MHPRDQRLIGHARRMRHDPTPAEQALWRILRGRAFHRLKFRRQVPIGPYIADFACSDARLVVEADGGQHGGPRDEARDTWLEAQGWRVIRLWNAEVLEHGDEGAWAALEARVGPP